MPSKKFAAYLSAISYLSKYSPAIAKICEPLKRLTSVKVNWIWNKTYDEVFNKAKTFIKKDVSMNVINKTEPLYIEIDIFGVGLGAGVL